MTPLGVAVHVLSLVASDEEVEALKLLLSEDECARAAVLRFDADRRRSIVARGRLRIVLAAYADGAPQGLRFAYGPYGKPWLPSASSLRFNLAHAGDRALVAIAHGREVGIDVERVERERDLADVARRFFSAAERRAVDELDASVRQTAVLRAWCRKEAYVKARGEGLSRPLDSFDMVVGAVGDAAQLLLATRPDASDVDRWLVRDIPMGAHWVGALAVEAHWSSSERRRADGLGPLNRRCPPLSRNRHETADVVGAPDEVPRRRSMGRRVPSARTTAQASRRRAEQLCET